MFSRPVSQVLGILLLGLAPALITPGVAQPAYLAQPWPAGQAVDDFNLTDASGVSRRLSEFRGRVVLLNFWATWCEPCRAEMPTLQALADLHGADRLVVLAVNFKEGAPRVAQFARSAGLSLPMLLDREGEVARKLGVRVFPSTLVIDPSGRARWRITGEVDWTSPVVRPWIEPHLGAAGKTARLIPRIQPKSPERRTS